MAEADPVPLLLDTDIGSDIDDAVALAYLLREPRCELLGITTVTGEPVERAKLADAICRASGRTGVPVFAGAERPLLVPQKQREVPQKTVLSRWPHREEFASGAAVPFLQQAIRSRPHEITLLAIGPLTNVALLFGMDAEIPRLLKRLVLMGGIYSTRVAGAPRAEWNTSVDPHAAAAVFQAPVPELVAYGLDVTLRCTMSAASCRSRMGGGLPEIVADMAEVWFRKKSHITFHDPLAAVGIFHREVCTYRRGRIEVELASPVAAGMTHWDEERSGPHRVASEVRPDQVFERYFGVFT